MTPCNGSSSSMAVAIERPPSKLDRLETAQLLVGGSWALADSRVVGVGGGTGEGMVGWLTRSRSSAMEGEGSSTAVAGMEALWGSHS